MSPNTPAPPGLRWLAGSFGRVLVALLAVASLVTSMYVGYRYTGLVNCLQERDLADQRRTAAIAAATDRERQADLALIRGQGDNAELRRAALTAREATDRTRAEHPAPAVQPCD